MFCGSATAATINVNPGTNTLKNAIITANTDDTLNLSAGTYYDHDLQVDKNLTITINFNEYIKAGSNNIEIKSISGEAIKITKYLSGKTLTIKTSSKLASNTKYTIYLHTGCVTDYKNNKIAAKNITFKTGSI